MCRKLKKKEIKQIGADTVVGQLAVEIRQIVVGRLIFVDSVEQKDLVGVDYLRRGDSCLYNKNLDSRHLKARLNTACILTDQSC